MDGCIDTDALDFNLCSADVTRTVYGYWQSFNGNDLWDRASLQLNDLRTKRGFRREISRQGVQILEIRLPGDLLGSDTARAVRLAAVMIGEVSKTLFPQTWQNLFVAVPKDGPEPEELIHRDASFEDRVRSILPYAEGMPEEPGFASLYLIEFSCVELGMVHTLYQNRRRLFSILRDYLEWYLAGTAETEPAQAEETPEDGAAGPLPEDAGSPPAPYLYYGGEEEPELFSSRALLELCRRFLPEEQSAAAPQAEPIGEEAMTDCTFCGRPTLYPVRMDDGRCMCSRCAQQQVSREEEVWDLFGETEAFMEKTYRIRFRKRIQVQFQSLDAIHRFAGEQTNGRYIGFYSPKLRQLWIERNGPRIAVQDTLIHELTHLWQYDNLEISRAQARLPVPPWQKAKKMLTILEGHAVYVEVETMRRLNEEGYAADLHDRYMAREDEYGEGYRTMRRYFEEKARLGSHMTPFASMQQLFDDIIHRRGREAGIL